MALHVAPARTRNLIAFAAAAFVAIALVVIGSRIQHAAGLGPSTAEVRALLDAECPTTDGLDLGGTKRSEVRAAGAGNFTIFDGVEARLVPPVDWGQDPIASRAYRQNLQKLRFTKPLIVAYLRDHNREALARALSLAFDWIGANDSRAPASTEAWTDKVVGDRSPYLAYITLAAACEGLLDEHQARRLLSSVGEHAAFLSRGRNYTPDNHGLFVDRGLLIIARKFPFLADALNWESLARRRFERTLRGRLSAGFWLEHSTTYQLLALRAVDGFTAILGGDRELEAIAERMRTAAAWFTEPDGGIVQFGDSDGLPKWADRRDGWQRGIAAFPGAGFAFARSLGELGLGYLAVTAGFHNTTHKHADELSFELYDAGRRIVTDTGLFHKDPSPERDFAISSRAHSVLTADGQSFPTGKEQALTYGGAVRRSGQGGGWFAITADNPLMAEQGIEHERLYLYDPGVALIVVDEVKAGRSHAYRRYLQLDPGIDATPVEDGLIALGAPGFQGWISDSAPPGTVTAALARGRREPLRGLTSPSFRKWVPRTTIEFKSRASSVVYVTTISFGPEPIRATATTVSPDAIAVDGGGPEPFELLVEAADDRHGLSVHRCESIPTDPCTRG